MKNLNKKLLAIVKEVNDLPIYIKCKLTLKNLKSNLQGYKYRKNLNLISRFCKVKTLKSIKKLKLSKQSFLNSFEQYISIFRDSEEESTLADSDINLLPPPPVWSRIMIWTFGSGSVFIIAWSIFTSVEENVVLQGEITTNSATVTLSTKDPGILSRVNIKPYQSVKAGETLLIYEDDETFSRLESLKKRLLLLKAKNSKDLAIYSLRIDQTETQIKLDKNLLEKYSLLAQEGAVSKNDFLIRETDLVKKILSLKLLKEERQNTELINQGKIEEMKNNVHDLISKSKRFVITSPIEGFVQDIKYQTPGERIQPGEILATIIPKSNLIATISIPSNLSAPIELNSPALLEIDAFPASDFGSINARVNSLSPMSGPANNNSPQRIYTAELAILDPESPNLLTIKDLRPGMGVTARIKLREKKIISTAFDILSGVFDPLTERKQ